MARSSSKKICVIGLGYIGLPTASMFATHGHDVYGVDINPHVIQTLSQGKIHIEEPGLDTVVKAAISSQRLHVSSSVSPADVFIIAVPTPYHHNASGIPTADLSYVKSALDSLLPHLKKGNLVILESTSPAGTTRDVIIPAIEKKGFVIGKEIGLAYCPERVIPGQALKELIGNDRIVGAVTPEWAEETKNLYRSFVSGEIFTTEPTVAEMVKILENTYRDVNIALANEAAGLCQELGINVWEVIQLANRHPRVNVHKPGPGVGGHCISVDPWFLVEQFPSKAKLIHLARTINDGMPASVVREIQEMLQGKSQGKIAILGLSYKGNVDDVRESPSLSVIRLLKEGLPQMTLAYFDPHVKSKDYPTGSLEETFQDADLAVILTAHDEFKAFDQQVLATLMKSKLIFDTHNILKAERWVPAGFMIHTLGSGVTFSKTVKSGRSS